MTAPERPRIGARFEPADHAEIAALARECGVGLAQAVRGLARCALDNCTPAQMRGYIRRSQWP